MVFTRNLLHLSTYFQALSSHRLWQCSSLAWPDISAVTEFASANGSVFLSQILSFYLLPSVSIWIYVLDYRLHKPWQNCEHRGPWIQQTGPGGS